MGNLDEILETCRKAVEQNPGMKYVKIKDLYCNICKEHTKHFYIGTQADRDGDFDLGNCYRCNNTRSFD